MATMRAVRLHAFGGPDVLKIEEAPRPEPKDGEVLIKVHAAGVNPVDWKIREGYTNRKLPLVPGWDVAGVIEKVGPGVTSVKPGDEVYGYFDLSRNGAYADYVTVPLEPEDPVEEMTPEQRDRFIADLEQKMKDAARNFEFEKAAQFRDKIKALKSPKIYEQAAAGSPAGDR